MEVFLFRKSSAPPTRAKDLRGIDSVGFGRCQVSILVLSWVMFQIPGQPSSIVIRALLFLLSRGSTFFPCS